MPFQSIQFVNSLGPTRVSTENTPLWEKSRTLAHHFYKAWEEQEPRASWRHDAVTHSKIIKRDKRNHSDAVTTQPSACDRRLGAPAGRGESGKRSAPGWEPGEGKAVRGGRRCRADAGAGWTPVQGGRLRRRAAVRDWRTAASSRGG